MSAVLDQSSSLERYGHNLTRLAQQGAFTPLEGQDAVAARMFQILLRNNKSNPMLLDDDESWRFSVLTEVVRHMAIGDAPEPLLQRQIIALDTEMLFANPLDDVLLYQEQIKRNHSHVLKRHVEVEPESDADWQVLIDKELLQPERGRWIEPIIAIERLRAMCMEMYKSAGSFILFVDHFHCFIEGEAEKYSIDTANLLVPMLARRQVQLIGACTLAQYRHYIERDAAFQRRFQEVVLPH